MNGLVENGGWETGKTPWGKIKTPKDFREKP